MRLDKYLKLARLLKRRTVAQEMAEVGAVRVNGRQAKPSAKVSDGDVLDIAYPKRILTIKVITADEVLLKRKAVPYEVVQERYADQDEKPW